VLHIPVCWKRRQLFFLQRNIYTILRHASPFLRGRSQRSIVGGGWLAGRIWSHDLLISWHPERQTRNHNFSWNVRTYSSSSEGGSKNRTNRNLVKTKTRRCRSQSQSHHSWVSARWIGLETLIHILKNRKKLTCVSACICTVVNRWSCKLVSLLGHTVLRT